MSDVHIGYKYSRAVDAVNTLNTEKFDRLILIGDIFDISNMINGRGYWDEHHTNFLKKLLKLAKTKEIIYVVGNHDYPLDYLKEYTSKIAGIQFFREYTYESGNKKITCVHGDEYENINPSVRKLGDILYHIGLWSNIYINVVRKWFNKPYWSFSKWCKDKVKTVISKAFDIEQKMGVAFSLSDKIIYGHTHMPFVGNLFSNTGSFVEIATYITEQNGVLTLHNMDNKIEETHNGA